MNTCNHKEESKNNLFLTHPQTTKSIALVYFLQSVLTSPFTQFGSYHPGDIVSCFLNLPNEQYT